ncbi:hypothetical protein FIBSPDRAFT_69044 [Athelia psychrophila]|uniref:Uncharacterized protein n=1 Tax=Athelia psychrophila TaxID=1759441 RepID=A0A166TR71_9AGAM|nr:hypothetical protein FIBSPDRAFT_69044 [Fibularhizoctonia sp. CBS 109695]
MQVNMIIGAMHGPRCYISSASSCADIHPASEPLPVLPPSVSFPPPPTSSSGSSFSSSSLCLDMFSSEPSSMAPCSSRSFTVNACLCRGREKSFPSLLGPWALAAFSALPKYPPFLFMSAPASSSKRTIASWRFTDVACSAVPCSPPVAFTSAPLLRSNWTMASRPS